MLDLESKRWKQLRHAYGTAEDIPELLRQLEAGEAEKTQFGVEPWHSIWSSLCHQGSVYTASFAAIPHIVNILESKSWPIEYDFFAFPGIVEVARLRKETPKIPGDCVEDYFYALDRLIEIPAKFADQHWDEVFTRSVCAAIAAVKGYPDLAEAIAELYPEQARKFVDDFWNA